MHTPHEMLASRKETRGGTRANTANLPAINKKALLNDTFNVPLKKKTPLTPLSNAPKTPKFNNFLVSSDQNGPLTLTFGALELAITGGIHINPSSIKYSLLSLYYIHVYIFQPRHFKYKSTIIPTIPALHHHLSFIQFKHSHIHKYIVI